MPFQPISILFDSFVDVPEASDPPPRVERVNFARSAFEATNSNRTDLPFLDIKQLWLKTDDTTQQTDASLEVVTGQIDPGHASRFTFAPIVESCFIHWRLKNHSYITGLLLELFVVGDPNPIWSKTLTWARGTCPETGSTPFHGDLRDDILLRAATNGESGVQIQAGDGQTYRNGSLNVQKSPYKLRASILPAQGAYRRTVSRTVFIDVEVESVSLAWGPTTWVENSRPDVAGVNILKVKQLEQTLLANLRDTTQGGHAQPGPGLVHEVKLPSDLFARIRTDQGVRGNHESVDQTDYVQHRHLWGHGPWIGLLAHVWVRMSGNGTRTLRARDALGSARMLWDWTDDDATRWKACRAGNISGPTEDYLDAAYHPAVHPGPPNTNNCPTERGGKLGDLSDEAAIFPPSTGVPPFPHVVHRATQRVWASYGDISPAGASGARFRPARMAGDRYCVRAVLDLDGSLDTVGAFQVPPAFVAEAGEFKVFRQVTVHHVLGASDQTLGLSHAALGAALQQSYRTELDIVVDVRPVPMSLMATHRAIRDTVRDLVRHEPLKTPCLSLLYDNLLDLRPLAGEPPIKYFDKNDFDASLEHVFQQGRVRRVEATLPLAAEEITGQTSGAKGSLLWRKENDVHQLLLVPNAQTAFVDGEQVLGTGTGAIAPLRVLDIPSCWGHTIALPTVHSQGGVYEDSVEVEINGLRHRVRYQKKALSRRLRSTASTSVLDALRAAVVQAARTSNEVGPLTIQLHGHSNSANAQKRNNKLLVFLEEIFTKEIVIDRKAIFADRGSWGAYGLFRSSSWFKSTFPDLFYDRFLKHYVQQALPNAEGVVVLHTAGRSNILSLAQFCPGVIVSPVEGGYYLEASDRRGVGPVHFSSIPPGTGVLATATKAAAEVFCHEVAHAMFIPHAPTFTTNTMESPGGFQAACHVRNDDCLMNYDAASQHFCGVCLVRLRGWKWESSGENEYQISIEMGDVRKLFSHSSAQERGRRARLGVLGLLNRPTLHPEAADAMAFAWPHAKALIPDLAGNNPARAFAKAIERFLVDTGKLPAPGAFAKIRLPTNASPFYSQAELMARFPTGDENSPQQLPYSRFQLGSDRCAVEKAFFDDNAAMGKIPIRVRVKVRPKNSGITWDNASPAPNAAVYVTLLKPDPVPQGVQSPEAVAGGKSLWRDVAAPPLAQVPADWVKANVARFQMSGGAQADNVHVTHGGLRGAAGQPWFCSTRAQGFVPLPAAAFANDANAVQLFTDDQGEVDFVFQPSRIGGDAYKLRAYVGPPTLLTDKDNPGEHSVITGTMVRWRTVRVSRHYVMNTGALPGYLAPLSNLACEHKGTTGAVCTDCLESAGDLVPLDFAAQIAPKLAQGYHELVLEPNAQATSSVAATRGDMLNFLDEMLADYPDINGKVNDKDTVPVSKRNMVEVLNSNRTSFDCTLETLTPDLTALTVRPTGGGVDSAVLRYDPNTNGFVDTGKIPGTTGTLVNGVVVVTFLAPQQGNFQVAYFADNYLDFDALLVDPTPATSPFLINLNFPPVYNQRHAQGYLDMPIPGNAAPIGLSMPSAYAFLCSRKTGGNKGAVPFVANYLLPALTRGVDANGGYYPGLVVVQATRLSTYDAIWDPGPNQEGKAVGQGVFLFGGSKDPNAGRSSAIALHEISHAMLLTHAPTTLSPPGGIKPERHDPNDVCVMSYNDSDGDHCGKCIAALRGINIAAIP